MDVQINVMEGWHGKKCRSHPGAFFADRTPDKLFRISIFGFLHRPRARALTEQFDIIARQIQNSGENTIPFLAAVQNQIQTVDSVKLPAAFKKVVFGNGKTLTLVAVIPSW